MSMIYDADHLVNIPLKNIGRVVHVHTAVYHDDDEDSETFDKIVHEHTCHVILDQPRPTKRHHPSWRTRDRSGVSHVMFTMLSTAPVDKTLVRDFTLVSRMQYITPMECRRAWSAIVKMNGDWFTFAKQKVNDIKYRLCVDALS